MKNSNCDKRLLQNIQQLHSQICGDANAVQIGIKNISFGIMANTFKNELPDALSAMLQAHNLSIGMYVAQFPDWNRFSENASASEISYSDIRQIESGSQKIIDFLENNPEIAEPKVSSTFKQLKEIITNPANASKRAAFAVFRTIENLLSKTFHYTISFFERTAEEVSKVASKATAIAIVTLAISGASELLPLSNKINELGWLKNAIEIVQKRLNLNK